MTIEQIITEEKIKVDACQQIGIEIKSNKYPKYLIQDIEFEESMYGSNLPTTYKNKVNF